VPKKKADRVLVVRPETEINDVRVYRIPHHLSLLEAREKLLDTWQAVEDDELDAALYDLGFRALTAEQIILE
jgi:hypothetical protein